MKKLAVILTVIILAAILSKKQPSPQEYQIRVEQDSLYIYDGYRHVGTITNTDDSEIGFLIQNDNL